MAEVDGRSRSTLPRSDQPQSTHKFGTKIARIRDGSIMICMYVQIRTYGGVVPPVAWQEQPSHAASISQFSHLLLILFSLKPASLMRTGVGSCRTNAYGRALVLIPSKKLSEVTTSCPLQSTSLPITPPISFATLNRLLLNTYRDQHCTA